MITATQIPSGFHAYIQCALWSSHDHSEDAEYEFLDGKYDLWDFDLDTLESLIEEYNRFITEAQPILKACDASINQIAHDFWLTRSEHGAGFWDDPEYYGTEENADTLTQLAQKYGELNIYVGDDGKLYALK